MGNKKIKICNTCGCEFKGRSNPVYDENLNKQKDLIQCDDCYFKLISKGYGTPESFLLKKIRKAGFKPIAISLLMCEETFVFKTKEEVDKAWKLFRPEGWWYPIEEWDETFKEYVKGFCENNLNFAPIIYWLDENYKSKES